MLDAANLRYAYDGRSLSNELYDTNQNATRDGLGRYVKFTATMIANGQFCRRGGL